MPCVYIVISNGNLQSQTEGCMNVTYLLVDNKMQLANRYQYTGTSKKKKNVQIELIKKKITHKR